MNKKIYKLPPNSLGCEYLRSLRLSGAELARLTSVSVVTTLAWLDGRFSPSLQMRLTLQRHFKIRKEAWDILPTEGSKRGVYARIGSADETSITVRPDVDQMTSQRPLEIPLDDDGEPVTVERISYNSLDAAHRLLREIRKKAGHQMTEDAQNKLFQIEINTIRLIENLTNTALILDDKIIKEHPQWKMLKRGILSCIVDCEACKDRVETFLLTTATAGGIE